MFFDLYIFFYNFYTEYVEYLIILIAAKSLQPLLAIK